MLLVYEHNLSYSSYLVKEYNLQQRFPIQEYNLHLHIDKFDANIKIRINKKIKSHVYCVTSNPTTLLQEHRHQH